MVWGIRLTANWIYTFQNLDWQDWRYTMLKEKTGKIYPLINLLGIHMFPTLVVYFCVLPAVYIFLFEIEFNAFSFLGFALSITATTIQLFADIEMQSFRKKIHQGFIRTGLWKYSRHPNYLAEILMWWNIGLLCVTSLLSYYYILVGALANTMLFFFVSIPLQEKKQAKKEGFVEYKKSTRMLLPIKK
jgi:steroid 5-alpha reductase family enzyme